MNITFLIGNGFDVGVGMKSKFEDFFPKYVLQSKNKESRIRQLADEIQKDCKKNGYYKTWADFELALGQYTLKFTPETKQNFIDQVKDFEIEFIKYLEEQEDMMSLDDKEKMLNVMKKALTQYYYPRNLAPESSAIIANLYATHLSENHVYNFINFNYTIILRRCLNAFEQNVVCKRNVRSNEIIDKIGEIVHVHGKSTLHPIIGVNDISQIANKALAEDTKFAQFIVKPLLNKRLKQSNDNSATAIINKSTIICIYGMSLGVTDKKWWDLLLTWLNGNSTRQLILFDYDKNYTAANQFDFLEKEDKLVDKLSEYNSSNVVNVEKLLPRIHIAIHRNIFSMNLYKSKEDIREVIKTTKNIVENIEEYKETMNSALKQMDVIA